MKENFLKCVIVVATILALGSKSTAQVVEGGAINRTSAAVPFLSITPDSRSGGMGDVGVATSADANAISHNAAKLAFAEAPTAIGLSYSPWLKGLGIDGVFLGYLSGYHRIDDRQTIAASFRYFTYGDIQFADGNGNALQVYKPSEFSFDAAYIRKLSETFSMSMAARYIHSDLGSGNYSGIEISAGNAFAADLGMLYAKESQLFGTPTNFSAGLNISNIGPKISYGNSKSFLPTTLKLGGTADFVFDENNSLAWSLDFNKLLVPENGNDETSVSGGIFDSFSSLKLGVGTGLEYWYAKLIAVRGGFYTDASSSDASQYVTTGLGVKYSSFAFDFSYLIPTAAHDPLEKTVRFSLAYNFNSSSKLKKQTNNN
ncbi:type IX secretion system outer membrane channel protein PorV [Solitalea sp. MAHUQ-68]|uniref:Type IX secretion system outer membrane channel protein PorV n=1 Tax=Solitalea agri TaxID=2953739 RepID=A0A9X2F9G2_9SPHI|nr:type IX secretion system outer membrane channel protein PorV [Solitalea agri]MCO4292918.1 type IX secretion system outer membrane channel protein PorV [Solitalea agri]